MLWTHGAICEKKGDCDHQQSSAKHVVRTTTITFIIIMIMIMMIMIIIITTHHHHHHQHSTISTISLKRKHLIYSSKIYGSRQ